MWRSRNVIPIVLLMLLALSCSQRTGVSPPPQAPQVTVVNYSNLLSESLATASTMVLAAHDGGRLSVESVRAVNKVIAATIASNKRVRAILLSSEAWDAQRVKIISEIVSSGVRESAKHLPSEVQPFLEASLTLLEQIFSKAMVAQ
jgi:hypothetical protein